MSGPLTTYGSDSESQALRDVMTDVVHAGRGLHTGDVRWMSPIYGVYNPGVFLHRGIEVVRCEGGRSGSRTNVEHTYAIPPHGEEAVSKDVLKRKPRSYILIQKVKPSIGDFRIP